MTFTDDGTRLPQGFDWMPLAMANGIQWATLRHGCADRWHNLYRHGVLSKLLWRIGALSTFFYKPEWAHQPTEYASSAGETIQ